MGATATYSIARIEERLRGGDELRDDGFFDCETSRSSADEIFEGNLLNSKRSHEEKKARFYGELFASIAFDSSVSRPQANHLLAITDSLTYQQLILLALLQGEMKVSETNHSLKANSVGKLSLLFERYTASINLD